MRRRNFMTLGGVATILVIGAAVFFFWARSGTPARGSVPDAVLVGAGDVAGCNSPGDEATAKLLDTIPGTVFVAGDVAYDAGTDEQFAQCYDPSWGRHKARTRPAVGNHEYGTSKASGYFKYFGAAAGDPQKGYYSYELGAWHIVVINSNCSKVQGCGPSSPQTQWLRADLAAHPGTCTLAYWHHPRFSSGEHGDFVPMEPIWQVLYDAGADVVVSGHDHDYERFAPMDSAGNADPVRGIREFVVGTGGKNHYGFNQTRPNSELRNGDTFGVIKFTLHATSYDWQFVPEAGKTFTDSGSGVCHSAGASGQVSSAPTSATTIAAPARAVPFSEGFESGDLSQWTSVDGLAIQEQDVARGEYAARGTSNGTPTFAFKDLEEPQNELYCRIRFKINSQGNNPLFLLRFRTDANASLIGVYVSQNGKLNSRNDVARQSSTSTASVTLGKWHDLRIHIQAGAANGRVDVSLDGNQVMALSKTEPFGNQLPSIFQLGENAKDRVYDVVFDDVVIDTHPISP